MRECAAAAKQCGNIDCLELVEMVLNMLILWGEYLDFRKETISRDPGKH
jgi:protein subunit release factor B